MYGVPILFVHPRGLRIAANKKLEGIALEDFTGKCAVQIIINSLFYFKVSTLGNT